jgi:hypothetical protein
MIPPATYLLGDDLEIANDAVERTVLFRDGTVLRVKLPADGRIPWQHVTPDGQVIAAPIRYDQVAQVTLVTKPATEQVAEVRRMIAALANPDYAARVAAQKELVERGAKFRIILETSFKVTEDFEARWRLEEVLKALPGDEAAIKADYDLLKTSEDGAEIDGDVGDWSVTTDYRGTAVTLSRANVRALRAAPLEFSLTAEPPVAIVNRIAEDRDNLFPKDVVRIDFERGPMDESLAVGEDIRRTYVAWGCTFTSVYEGEEKFVSVEPYNVGGRSGGRCAANHNPLYQGVMTVRFCLPGNERAPAGVRYVGFWTSHIAVDGTTLEAYDVRGRRIAEIKTIRSQRDFLALESNTPIAYIKIVPNEEVDPDYAIDDLVFDTPKPLAEAGDPEHYTVLLTSGERLHCDSLEPGKMVTLKGITIGIDRLEIPLEEVAIVVPPKSPALVSAVPESGFVRLRDGSILRCQGGERLTPLRLGELVIDAEHVVALWGGETTLVDPEMEKWPASGALLVEESGETRTVDEWKLGPKWIEADALSALASEGAKYENSPLVLFAKPQVRLAGSGLLRLVSGEEIVLTGPKGEPGGFELDGWSAEGATISRGQQKWQIEPHEIGSLLLPGRGLSKD